MRRPNMSRTIRSWATTHRVKTVTRLTVDFEPADVVVGRDVEAVVQPADKTKLNPAAIDWSLRYLQVHALTPLKGGEFIEYEGADFKLVDDTKFSENGFHLGTAEETKRPVLVET